MHTHSHVHTGPTNLDLPVGLVARLGLYHCAPVGLVQSGSGKGGVGRGREQKVGHLTCLDKDGHGMESGDILTWTMQMDW